MATQVGRRRYAATVSAVGAGVAGVALVGAARDLPRPAPVWVLAGLVVLGELVPIRVPLGDEPRATLSTAFVFALLLVGELDLAVLAHAVASTVAAILRRRPGPTILFDAARSSVSVAGAGLILHVLAGHPLGARAPLTAAGLGAVLGSGLTWYTLDRLLAGTAVASSRQMPVRALLQYDMVFQVAALLVVLSQAPLLVIALDRGMWLLPLFLPASFVAYRHGRESVERAHDALTGLPNRASFRRHVRREIDRDVHQRHVVLLVDLDQFRDVNDTLGQRMGDRLLVETSERLREQLDPVGFVARLSGDEFAVFATIDTRDDALGVCALVREAFARPIDLDGLPFRLDASVGAAIHPWHGDDAEQLLQRADVAMYLAKERRSHVEMYSRAIDRYDPRRLALLGDLRQALQRQELVVHYQAKASMASGEIIGAEALVRWEHPDHGVIQPDEFVPLADTTGELERITQWIADQAIRDCAGWRTLGYDLCVSINLSPRALHDHKLPADLRRLLERHRLEPAAFEVEITESGALQDVDRARQVLEVLRMLGIGVALDDFGTGHSSLAHLRRLPVDSIKIDKSFVMSMLTNEDDASIVASTLKLAHSLGLRVVAEGVEGDDVWHALASQGCDFAQGYYLGRPMPGTTFMSWLRSSHRPIRRLPGATRAATPSSTPA